MSAALVYLDYAATTPVAPEVAARMAECLTREGTFGNPGSASHAYGEAASAAVEAARAQVAAAVGAQAADVVFTSGATEANNLAIFGTAQYYRERGRHIVTARTEHKSVLDPCKELERRGWSVTYLAPDAEGALDPARVAAALRPDTVLVSLMHVNNETGVIQDIAAIAALVRRDGAGAAACRCGAERRQVRRRFRRARHRLDVRVRAQSLRPERGGCAAGIAAARRCSLTPHLAMAAARKGRCAPARSRRIRPSAWARRSSSRAPRSRRARAHRGTRERLWRRLRALGGVLRNGERAARCRTCSMCRSRAWRARACSPRCSRTSRCPRVGLHVGARRSPRMCCARSAGTIGWRRAALRFSLGRFTSEADIDAAATVVTRAVERLRRIAGT